VFFCPKHSGVPFPFPEQSTGRKGTEVPLLSFLREESGLIPREILFSWKERERERERERDGYHRHALVSEEEDVSFSKER